MARYDDTFVGRFLEPWNRHDVDGALALMTDDCVWEVTRGREPHGTLDTGQTAVRSAIVAVFKALHDVNYHPVRNSFRRRPCRGGTPGHRHARGRQPGFHACDILTLRKSGSSPPSGHTGRWWSKEVNACLSGFHPIWGE